MFDTFKSIASSLLGNANADPSQVADHLAANTDSLDRSSLMGLGQQLLQTFGSHEAYSGDEQQAAAEAGTTPDAVASGSPEGVSSLLNYAKGHPQILSAAVAAFEQRNPGVLMQAIQGGNSSNEQEQN